MLSKQKILITMALLAMFGMAIADSPNTFAAAKKQAKVIFDKIGRKTFYCYCSYDKQLKVDLTACRYKVRKNQKRASSVEWEHIVPAENFGRGMPSRCWSQAICQKDNGQYFKGRACCIKVDPKFNQMHNDLHNLVPAVGEVNADRSNYRFSELSLSDHQYGDCDFKIDFSNRKVEPSNRIKGVAARAYLYFEYKYSMKLSKQQRQLFSRWNLKYPPETWEVLWDDEIRKVQGDSNPYISSWAHFK